MCGRYTDTKRVKAQLASAGYEAAQADLGFAPRYNIAPTQKASIVALGAGKEGQLSGQECQRPSLRSSHPRRRGGGASRGWEG
jgi:putative SOS response-associated peptidase YedK